MKKIIMAAMIACVAAASQAAAIGWTCAGANDYKNGNYGIFVIGLNGVSSTSQIKSIIEAGGLDAASDYMFGSGTINASGVAMTLATASGKSITYKEPPATAADNTYSAFVFVQDTEGKKASFSGTVETTLANNSTGKTFTFNSQAGAFSSNAFTVNTPEPTTGVLLLLGMAGLALKRKRA